MGKKKSKKPTLQRVLLNHVFGVWLIFIFFFVVCDYMTVRGLEDEAIQTENVVVEMYVTELEGDLARAEDWLLYPEHTIQNIVNSAQGEELQLEKAQLEQIKNALEKVQNTLGVISGFFYYEQGTDTYLDSAEQVNERIEQLVGQYVKDGNTIPDNWFLVQGEEWYFLRLVQRDGFYIGAWFELEKYAETYNVQERRYATYITFATGEAIENDIIAEKNITNLTDKKEVAFDNEEYVVATAKFKNLECYLCSIISRDKLFFKFEIVEIWLYFVMFLLTGTFLTSVFRLHKKILVPVKKLADAMKHLGAGEIDTRMDMNVWIQESAEIQQTFNEMADKIEALKIDVYEETIKRQNVNMLYLQSQLKPHFLVNCLNVIRGLARKNETKKIEELTMYLSTHIRESLSLETRVTLLRELEHVRQYIAIQQMRYSDKLVLIEDIEEGVLEAIIPPMVILTFVENSVKYQIGEDGSLQIMVTLRKVEDSLVVIIEDNGEGFPKEILPQLQNKHQIRDERGEHVGIHNVCQRLQILYKEKASIKFSNKEQGGAVVEIRIPYETE